MTNILKLTLKTQVMTFVLSYQRSKQFETENNRKPLKTTNNKRDMQHALEIHYLRAWYRNLPCSGKNTCKK